MRLQDKAAIITGGGGGIGRYIALAFAREGAKSVIADINLEDAEGTVSKVKKEITGAEAIAVRTDVADNQSVEEMVAETITRFGGVDILVNNAAMMARYFPGRNKPFYEIDLDEWDQVMKVNLKGPFQCMRAVFPQMKEQGRGKIINIVSTLPIWGGTNLAHYIASKGGLIGLSRSLAREMGDYNINVNSVAPGSTFSDPSGDDAARNRRSKAIEMRILKRIEIPDDVVGTIVFLASDESDFITGQTIAVDGGQVLL